jgi:signal transduction histidine kinase
VALPPVASIFSITLGFFVLLGWAFDLEQLKRVTPGFGAMNPATAVLFILIGTSFGLTLGSRRSRLVRIIGNVLAGVVALAALAELIELTGFWHSPLDEFLFAGKLWDPQSGIVNRMAPNTALNLLFAGIAILELDLSGRRLFGQALAIVIGFVAVLSLTGYAYDARAFTGIDKFVPMAVHSAVAFLLLAGGILFAVPHAPLIEPFATDDPRGVLARRLFPLTVLLTLFLGWACVWGIRHELFDDTFGIALYAVSLSIFFVVLVRWTVGTVGRLEAERVAINARLHELNRRKDEMIAVVSHDLCSPLTGFRMVIDLLREGREEPNEELLSIMDQSARRMVSMVRGLLDISKLQAEKVELELEEFRLSELIRHVMQPLVINANAKHIDFTFHPPLREPLLCADRLRVSQIFSNLLTNAIKFTSSGGAVEVEIEPGKDMIKARVRDTGLGIPKNELPHIFEKYRQTATKSTAGEQGAGLGLAIVREMVLLHGGKISVSSEVNRGSVFSVSLPLKPAMHAQKTA